MACCLRVALWLVAGYALVTPGFAKDPPPPRKAKVEFRWLAAKPVKGFTEETGIQTSCAPHLLYPHLKPVLTSADVAEAVLRKHDFSKNGIPGDLYSVDFRLTDAARMTLVKEAGEQPSMLLAIFVNGRYLGTGHFEKDRADRFTPTAGFMNSKEEAEGIVEAIK